MRYGFTLIELVIAIAISSIIGVLLFNIFSQSNRLLTKVNSIVAADMNIVAFYDRFEKDISGAFIPIIGDLELAKEVLAKHEIEVRSQEVKKEEEQGAAKKIKPIEPVTLKKIQVRQPFIYEQKGNNLSLFSCITCNPLQVYKQIKPRIARIIYTLKPDPMRSGTYQLLRKESKKLGFNADKKARSFILLHNIRSLRLEFLAPEPEKKPSLSLSKDQERVKKDQPEKAEKKKKERPKPLKTYTKWPIKESKNGDRDLPQFVNVFLDYYDPYENVSRNYTFVFPLFNYKAPTEAILNVPLMLQERLKKEEEEPEKKPKKKSKEPGKEPKK